MATAEIFPYVVQKIDGSTGKAVGPVYGNVVRFNEEDAVEAAESLAIGSEKGFEFHVRANLVLPGDSVRDEDAHLVAAPCHAHGCNAVASFKPGAQPADSAGRCERCDEPFCEEDLTDVSARGDDGSGQYVTDLNGWYCIECADAPPDEPYID